MNPLAYYTSRLPLGIHDWGSTPLSVLTRISGPGPGGSSFLDIQGGSPISQCVIVRLSCSIRNRQQVNIGRREVSRTVRWIDRPEPEGLGYLPSQRSIHIGDSCGRDAFRRCENRQVQLANDAPCTDDSDRKSSI